MPVTRHGRQQRKSGGVATKPEARRIAANIAKLTELRRGKASRLGRAIARLGSTQKLIDAKPIEPA